MKLYQKLITAAVFGSAIALSPFKSNNAWSQPLDQQEIRNLAKSITVKIVESQSQVNGSGVLFNYKNDVYSVLTNQHVAGNTGEYEIYTPDGEKHEITYKEEVPGLDLMVVQFKSENYYETAELGDSEEIAPLELVYVAGFPAIQADLDIVDGKIRSIRQDVLQNPQNKKGYALVYTNETLPGSSGGAILNEQGYLVGINGEAERDIRSGRDISRGIPINLFISLSFNHLPEDQFEVEQLPEELEEEVYEEPEVSQPAPQPAPQPVPQPVPQPEIAYVPTVAGNSSYSLAYNISQNLEDRDDAIRSVAITPNGQTVVTGGEDHQVKVWNGLTGKLEQTFPGHEGGVKTVAVSDDGSTIVSGGEDGLVKVWNRSMGKLEWTFDGHEEHVNSVALSGDRNIIISGGGDNLINVWNRNTKKLDRTLEGHEDEVKSVAISADGNTVVSGGQDKRVKIWNLSNWELKNSTEGHEEEIRAIAISPDGRTIVTGSGDRSVKIWDSLGRLIHTFNGHTNKVESVAISSDGQQIISGSRDHSIKIWNIATKSLEQSLTTTNPSKINSIAASANSQIVVSGGKDNSLAIWYRK